MRCVAAAAWRALLLLCLAAGPWALARAGMPVQQVPTVKLEAAIGSIDAEARGLFWIDSLNSASVEQVALTAPARFQPMQPGVIYTPGESGTLWLYYRLERERTQPQNWLIEFPVPVLDLVTVYQRDSRGQWQAQTAGDTLAVDAWPDPGRYPFFRLDLPQGQPRDIFVRIRHTTPISLPVMLSSQSSHDQRIQIEYMGLGMAFGALILLIAACLAQAWVYRDRVYAWYSGYATLMTLAVAAYTGVGGHLLWSSYGYWTDASQGLLALLAAGAALLFVRNLAGVSNRFRWLDRTAYWGGWAGIPLAGAFLLVSKPVGLAIVGGYVASAAITNTWIAWLAWRRGDVVGRWVLAAYVPLTLSVLLAVLRLFGLLPISFGTQYAVVLGSALEVPLLLVALSIRSRERHGVQIRELALSSQDALTGLLAAHLFHDRLRQVVSRYRRDQQHAAVLFIDLVNYERIKSFHGSAVAEQSLLRCVIKLRRLVRDVDTVSRVGEARFGLILEGVNSRAAVTDRAARLIAAGLMPLKGLKPEVTLQFHIGSVLLSERLMDAPALASALAELLGSMSSRTRRPIRFLEPEATLRMPLGASSLYDGDDDSQLPKPGADPHPAQSNA
ncbi:MAG: diguanylate cyclase [Ramlibacter sp.]|nr:diguanylate cyclase [Ramlibacter sp.]